MEGFTCLVIQKFSLTDYTRSVLMRTAIEMLKQHENKRRFRTDQCEGIVKTTFEQVRFVTIPGIRFFAEIETEIHCGRVTFIIENRKLTELARLCAIPAEEIKWEPVSSLISDDELDDLEDNSHELN